MLLKATGNFREAETLLKDAAQGRKEVLGPHHPETLSIMNSLAMVLQSLERLDEAEAYFRETLEGCHQSLGPNHPNTATARENLEELLRIMEGTSVQEDESQHSGEQAAPTGTECSVM
jgi:uncharacterized protein involved in exopolysaccharide biosynthesis